MISVIHPDDERSIKVAERLGERLEWTVQLHQADALIYGISVEQWRRTVSVRTPSP